MRHLLISCLLTLLLGSCGSVQMTGPASGRSCAPKPNGGLLGTFDTPDSSQDERFWVAINNQPGIDDAINSWRGGSTANIPADPLVCQPVAWNCGWSWYEDPQTVRIEEAATEVCDARPFPSQSACEAFKQSSPNGYYCPWSAKLVELWDCRTDPACPMLTQ